jgi:hypothetical protein
MATDAAASETPPTRGRRTPANSAANLPYTGEPKGAYRPKEFQTRYRVGHTKVYQEIAAGRLIARKVGSATIILHEDAEAWARALPMVQPAEAARTSGTELVLRNQRAADRAADADDATTAIVLRPLDQTSTSRSGFKKSPSRTPPDARIAAR